VRNRVVAVGRRISVGVGCVGLLALAGCGGTDSRLVVSVVSQDRNPVPHAVVSVAGTSARGTTDRQGRALLIGLRAGAYVMTASARGYYTTTLRRRLRPGYQAIIELAYRPPLGHFVWNIGPAGEFWDLATITKTGITATEWDWTCQRDPRTGKIVGRWIKFAGAPPYAVAPGTIAPEWVPKRFPATGPPTPPSDCGTSPPEP
jgi:hypothetical protein